MNFVSGIFPVFLLVTLLVYYLVPKKSQWIVLLCAGICFYAFAGWRCLLYIVLAAANTFCTARIIDALGEKQETSFSAVRDTLSKEERKARRAQDKKKRFGVLLVGLIIGIGLLCIPKYTGFIVDSVNGVCGTSFRVPHLLLPMGLSFYTFQGVGYMIDVYWGKVKACRNPFRYALFVSFFPQLIQGPISRYADLDGQLTAPHAFAAAGLRAGALRVLWGYFKKVVMADTAMTVVKAIVADPDTYHGVYVVLLLLVYSIVIYGDFTGGIDITIGVAEMFGITLHENFDHPFSSRTTKEYWRRWHMTMGTWFADYIFYPMSVSRSMQKLSKWGREHLGNAVGKRLPVYLATLVTWFLTGLWHGAGWNFIVWGVLNGVVILAAQELTPLFAKITARHPQFYAGSFWTRVQMVRTFLLMGLIRTLDCYCDVPLTFKMWGSIFGSFGRMSAQSLHGLGLSLPGWLLVGVCVLAVWLVSRVSPNDAPLREKEAARPMVWLGLCLLLLTVILIFGAYGIGYDAGAFIYKQF